MKSFVIFLKKIKFKKKRKLRKSKKLFTQSELSVLVCMAVRLPFHPMKIKKTFFEKWIPAVFHSLQIIQIQFVRLDGEMEAIMDLLVGFRCVKNDIYISILNRSIRV